MSELRKKTSKPKSRSSLQPTGFTLIEVIVAMAVMATSMLAIFGVLGMCAAADSRCKELTKAVLLAERLLAEKRLVETVYQNTAAYQTKKGTDGRFDWQIETAPAGKDHLAAVSVEIRWRNQNKLQCYHLCSLIQIRSTLTGK
jgi:type II secretion system protein I